MSMSGDEDGGCLRAVTSRLSKLVGGRGGGGGGGRAPEREGPPRVLVLGFYGRHNLGDESYKRSFAAAFGTGARLTFVCIDDAEHVGVGPGEYDLVVVGGGDVICPYFMDKLAPLLADHAGAVCAVSVGVPYAADARYLRLFDHVFARSAEDHALAVAELGASNATLVPDACALLRPLPLPLPLPPPRSGRARSVAVCLAQPMFHGNAHAPGLVSALCDALARFAGAAGGAELHLLPFNTNEAQPSECDLLANAALAEALRAAGVRGVVCHGALGVDGTLRALAEADLVVASRFHAVAFAMLVGTPFAACYVSSKVGKLLRDAGCAGRSVEMPHDACFQPTCLDADALLRCMRDPARARLPGVGGAPAARAYAACAGPPASLRRSLLDRPGAPRTLEQALESARDLLGRHLGRELDGAAFDALLRRRGALAPDSDGAMAAARVVAFAVTGSTNSACVWGLHENMQTDGFCLLEAVEFVHRDHCEGGKPPWTPPPEGASCLEGGSKGASCLEGESKACLEGGSKGGCPLRYHPAVPGAQRRLLLDLTYMAQDTFRGCHRSGWAYAVGGLMLLDGPSVGRRGRMMLDTYVDRTFHWGRGPLQLAGAIPYRAPWAGFVHHTFDTTHSEHNCAALFAEPAFLASLAQCRGLFALSRALAAQLESALASAGHPGVPVHALPHPTEPVDARMEFTPARFAANKSRRIVQVGAWLRDPYAIYELPVPDDNPLRLRKAVLRGKDMDGYFAPPDLMEGLRAACAAAASASASGPAPAPAPAPAAMCRSASRPANRYCDGMLRRLARDYASVEQLERIDDAAYDALLSENVVFLRLVDCSAVNTVVECIARATPLFVNRLPAIEELLGAGYPGFYSSLAHAAELACDARVVAHAHAHLRCLDRSALSLEAFVSGVQRCLSQDPLVRRAKKRAEV